MLAYESAVPVDCHVHQLGSLLRHHDDAFHQGTDQIFPVLDGRACGLPQTRQVRSQLSKLIAFGISQSWRNGVAVAVVLLVELTLLAQRLLAAFLQRPRDETVLRLDCFVLSGSPLGFVPGPFQTLLSVLMELLPIAVDVVGGAQAQLQARGFLGA